MTAFPYVAASIVAVRLLWRARRRYLARKHPARNDLDLLEPRRSSEAPPQRPIVAEEYLDRSSPP